MSWSDISGHQKQKEFFRRAVLSGRVTHAYLFSGPSRVGKTTFALELAKFFNCQNPTEDGSCNQCKNCRLIANFSHPDVSLLSPSDGYLKIDQIRNFTRWIGLKPTAGKTKVGIIEEAERLTEEAANCLLKTLEEPPGESMIILTTSQRASLLPTIISRCQLIEFSPLSYTEIYHHLIEKKGWEEEEARKVASLSPGSWARAEEIKKGKGNLEDKFWELWNKLKDQNHSLPMGQWFYDNKEQLPLIITFLEQYLRDLWVWKVTDGRRTDLLFFEKEKVEEEAKRREVQTWKRLIVLVDNLMSDISGNLNWDIVLCRFLFSWRGEWNRASSSRN